MSVTQWIRDLESEHREKNPLVILAERVIKPKPPQGFDNAWAFIKSDLMEYAPKLAQTLIQRSEVRQGWCDGYFFDREDLRKECEEKGHISAATGQHFVPINDEKAFNNVFDQIYWSSYNYERGDDEEKEDWKWQNAPADATVRMLLGDKYEDGEFTYKNRDRRMLKVFMVLALMDDEDFDTLILKLSTSLEYTISDFGHWVKVFLGNVKVSVDDYEEEGE